MEANQMAGANRIAPLRMEIAMTIDMIKENPTSVKTDKVLDALEKYLKALERKQKKLQREMKQEGWSI